jgi:hypothetical protein
MAVQEEHCPQNESSPHKRSKLTILAHQMMQGVVFEEWWEVWAMDGKWRASSGRIDVRSPPFILSVISTVARVCGLCRRLVCHYAEVTTASVTAAVTVEVEGVSALAVPPKIPLSAAVTASGFW